MSIDNSSKRPYCQTLDSRFLPLSNMVLHTQHTQSDAYKKGNHPIASRDNAIDSDVLLVGLTLPPSASE